MEMLLERISDTADSIIEENFIRDMTKDQIIDLIGKEDFFIRTITSICPTSFLTCC